VITTLAFALLAGGGVFAATAVARTGGSTPSSAHALCADEQADSGRFEVVVGWSETLLGAGALQTRARRAGFSARIERDTCTRFEVAVGRLRTRVAAARTLAWVKHAGFRGATIEADAPVTGTATTPTTPVATVTTAAGTGTTAAGGGGGGGGGGQPVTTTDATTTTTTTATTPVCTVTRKPDDHVQYEVIFGRTQTLAAAESLLVQTNDAGFAAGIEVDSCTEYEVAIAGFYTHAAAGDVVARAKSAGFSGAQTENS
jgi:hypothetical protein